MYVMGRQRRLQHFWRGIYSPKILAFKSSSFILGMCFQIPRPKGFEGAIIRSCWRCCASLVRQSWAWKITTFTLRWWSFSSSPRISPPLSPHDFNAWEKGRLYRRGRQRSAVTLSGHQGGQLQNEISPAALQHQAKLHLCGLSPILPFSQYICPHPMGSTIRFAQAGCARMGGCSRPPQNHAGPGRGERDWAELEEQSPTSQAAAACGAALANSPARAILLCRNH